MHDDIGEQAREQQLDWGLGEIEGGAVPPDVTARVLASVSRTTPARSLHVARSRWLAGAAVIVISVGAVIAVRLSTDPTPDREGQTPATGGQDSGGQDPGGQDPGTQDPGEPPQLESHVIRAAADVATLPVDARWVVVVNQGDAVLRALAVRCAKLERLHVSTLSDVSSSPTDALFDIVATFTGLRELHLVKTVAVTGSGVERLRALPLLESLALAMVNLTPASFEVFPQLPSLRVLDLSYTRGLDDDAMRTIARCPGLRQLGIAGCADVTAEGLAQITKLTTLETLEARQLRCSLGDLRIDQLTRLRALDVASTDFPVAFVERLPPSLTELSVGSSWFDDDGCKALRRRLPNLRELRAGATGISDAGLAELIALPGLRELDIARCGKLTEAGFEILSNSDRLCRVRLEDLSWLVSGHVESLMEHGIDVDAGTGSHLAKDVQSLRARYRAAIAARRASGGATADTSTRRRTG